MYIYIRRRVKVNSHDRAPPPQVAAKRASIAAAAAAASELVIERTAREEVHLRVCLYVCSVYVCIDRQIDICIYRKTSR